MLEADFIFYLRIAYGLVGAGSLIGYVPTIKVLLEGEKAANRSSYFVWTITGIVSTTYAVVVVKDFMVTASASINLFFCIVIYLLTFKKFKEKNCK